MVLNNAQKFLRKKIIFKKVMVKTNFLGLKNFETKGGVHDFRNSRPWGFEVYLKNMKNQVGPPGKLIDISILKQTKIS